MQGLRIVETYGERAHNRDFKCSALFFCFILPLQYTLKRLWSEFLYHKKWTSKQISLTKKVIADADDSNQMYFLHCIVIKFSAGDRDLILILPILLTRFRQYFQ